MEVVVVESALVTVKTSGLLSVLSVVYSVLASALASVL